MSAAQDDRPTPEQGQGDDPRALTQWDHETFRRLTSVELSPEQTTRLATPPEVHLRQRSVLAVHWHPEWIPMELITRRLRTAFPNSDDELIIPTQHNELLTLGDYAGVEIDCYSSGFKRKVQLLLHFRAQNLERADVLRSMLSHTFKYRSGQLWEYLDSLTEPSLEDRRQEAAAETGANEDVVEFLAAQAGKLKTLLEQNEASLPPIMIKNKLVLDYLDALRRHYSDRLVNRAQLLARAVKQIVKREFSLQYFYRASEVIEEARALGAGVVIPHPEQFWPILLADYDIDGYEVWNPQSRQYTEFLITVLGRQNKQKRGRRLLVFMGDDAHLSEKAKDPALQDRLKAAREVGLQPAWDDPAIRKALMLAGMDRRRVIEQYRQRLA